MADTKTTPKADEKPALSGANTQGDTRTSIPVTTTDLGLDKAHPAGKGNVVNRPGVPGQSLDRHQHDSPDEAPLLNAFATVTGGDHNGAYGVVETIDGDRVVIRTRDENHELIEVKAGDVKRALAGGRR